MSKHNKNGKREGKWEFKRIDFLDNKVTIICDSGLYINGNKEGLWIETVDGVLRRSMNYRNNKKHGLHKTYMIIKGKSYLWLKTDFINDIEHGYFELTRNGILGKSNVVEKKFTL